VFVTRDRMSDTEGTPATVEPSSQLVQVDLAKK
jgi:hypothetical protein